MLFQYYFLKSSILKNLVFGVLIFFTIFLSSAISMLDYDKEELNKVHNIINKKEQIPLIKLKQKLTKGGFLCEELPNAYSGGVVLKLQAMHSYVLKVQDSIPEYFHEISVTKITGKRALSPKVLLSGEGSIYRYMVMEFLKGPPLAKFMEFLESSPLAKLKTGLNIDWKIIGPIVKTVRRLHSIKDRFPLTTTIYEFIQDHFSLIAKHSIPVPQECEVIKNSFNNLMLFLAKPEHFKPCHFDLHGHNIFFDENKKEVKLIDWGYAGIGNMYLELAAISLNLRFVESEDREMLNRYFCRDPFLEEDAYFFIGRTLCLGVYAIREFIRPYFEEFPPFSLLKTICNVEPILASSEQTKYDDILTRIRLEQHTIEYNPNLGIGILMLKEYIYRLRNQKMQNIIHFLNKIVISRKLLAKNKYLYEIYMRSLLVNRPDIFNVYYKQRINSYLCGNYKS